MKSKVLIMLLLLVSALMTVEAQIQCGIVRTALRPNREVIYLSDVMIRQRGDYNPVLSDADGGFEMTMAGLNVGDAFYLSSVSKSGYELADNRTIGRAFVFSPDVKIEIVMLNLKEKEEDMQRISDIAYQRAEATYAGRLAELEKKLKEKNITEEIFRKQLQELQYWYEKYESLIKDMAERYASTDYATIDSLNAAVNMAIEDGDLGRADSLISSVGSLEKLVDENKEAELSARKRLKLGEKMAANASADLDAIYGDKNRIGDLLYSKYNICLSRTETDSAAYYMRIRAELDTANVEWQLMAGTFISDYLAEYDNAMAYYKRALCNALEQYDETHPYVVTCYNYRGVL